MPLSIYLDHRTHGDELAWNPSTALWVVGSLVWLLNIAVGGTYCLRRQVAVRRSAPSRHWHSIVVGSIVVWTGLVALDQTLPAAAVSGTAMDGITGLVALAWIGLPIAILFDAVRIRGYTDWNPNVRVLVFGAAIPLVNVVVGAAYLYKRRAEFDGVDPTQAFVLRDDGNPGTDESGVASSPWFRRAGYVFGAYFLFVVLIGAVTPSLSGASFELLALLAWVPFARCSRDACTGTRRGDASTAVMSASGGGCTSSRGSFRGPPSGISSDGSPDPTDTGCDTGPVETRRTDPNR
jgi:hypothetical protein